MSNNLVRQKIWTNINHWRYGDVVITLFGGIIGAFLGFVVGFVLAQLFLAVVVFVLLLGVDPSFNSLAWAIYVALASIWIGTAIGCWYFLRGKYEGAELTAALVAATLVITFYLVSFDFEFLLLALAIPAGRVIYRTMTSLGNLLSFRVSG
jgi:hypothetical protein